MWKLVNFKIDLAALERIDAEARKASMTRTAYIVHRCDPANRLANEDVAFAASYSTPEALRAQALVPKAGPRKQMLASEPAPFKSRLKGQWKAP